MKLVPGDYVVLDPTLRRSVALFVWPGGPGGGVSSNEPRFDHSELGFVVATSIQPVAHPSSMILLLTSKGSLGWTFATCLQGVG